MQLHFPSALFPSPHSCIDDGDLDFGDGDVILALAEHKYHIHKSVLSAQSEVFADMFSMPSVNTSSESEKKIASAPVVPVYDEHEPFKLFLHVLYNHEYAHSDRFK